MNSRPANPHFSATFGSFHPAAGDHQIRIDVPAVICHHAVYPVVLFIQEQDVDLSVTGQQSPELFFVRFPDLLVIGAFRCRVVPAGRQSLHVTQVKIIGRKIQSGGNALIPECFRDLRQNVFSIGCVGDLEFDRLGIPHAETAVVPGGEHHVFHSRHGGQSGPHLRVELFGIERIRHFIEVSILVILR